MRGATCTSWIDALGYDVSIHAPHAGRDGARHIRRVHDGGFNPRAPCGARHTGFLNPTAIGAFQSTRPMRGATHGLSQSYCDRRVSIHAPHAGRDGFLDAPLCFCISFNPRAPCGARLARSLSANAEREFQSTRPMRGATTACTLSRSARGVSIHAPHAGRDSREQRRIGRSLSFNPRAPCGARPARTIEDWVESEFQSTRPMRGATSAS